MRSKDSTTLTVETLPVGRRVRLKAVLSRVERAGGAVDHSRLVQALVPDRRLALPGAFTAAQLDRALDDGEKCGLLAVSIENGGARIALTTPPVQLRAPVSG